MKKINVLFKWNNEELFKALVGSIMFCIAINFFISPENLYNGGILGISQLMEKGIKNVLNLKTNASLSGLIFYIINIPLFVIAYKNISKTFFTRTLFLVTLQSVLLSVIPVLDKPLVDDIIVNVLIGAIIAGAGSGMVLSTGASSGGTDIIGVVVTKKNNNFSVGKLGLAINICIYTLTGILYGIQIAIYSVIYSVISGLVTDKTHEQNINSNAFIFTKNNPKKIIKFIKEELNRDATYWDAKGGYSDTKTNIIYVILSKYEYQRLSRHIHEFDKNAFMVKIDDVDVKGNYYKQL